MFTKNDEKYIKRLISRNEVVLFLGSGFSRDAKNLLNEDFPTGNVLCEKLWSFLGYAGVYDGTSLQELYQAFVSSSAKRQVKKDFLINNLTCGAVPNTYNSITIPYWYKIYTVNVDDVLTKVFRRNNKLIRELKFPKDEFAERDQSLESTQIVYLHGKLPCEPDDIIFSTKQYVEAGIKDQPLYSQFVWDYAVLPTIFVGTEINEPLFEKYIESRKGRDGYAERRPKSFLITPTISPARKDNLEKLYNIHHIVGTTADFLNWIELIKDELKSKNEILRDSFPSYLTTLEFSPLKDVSKKSIYEFTNSLKRVPKEFVPNHDRSAFLIGATPCWQDIFKDLDIPRTISKTITEKIEELYLKNDKLQIVTISGSAGSGKSTIIKRLGLTLSQSGKTVFYSDSEIICRQDYLTDVLSAIKEKVVIIFDNAKNVLSQISKLVDSLNGLDYIPILILSIRSNHYDKLNSILDPIKLNNTSINTPNLDDVEINNLIEKLENHNLLGTLKGLPMSARINEFKNKANKQILIAMKEATRGKPFEEIINDEFNEINPTESKLLCLCVALCTETGFTCSKQNFVSFSEKSPAEALEYLNTNLNGIVLQIGEKKDRLMLRHRILAEHIILNCVSTNELKCAYIRVLSALSPMINSTSYSTLNYRLYLSLINHKILYRRFKNDINKAREVFDSITTFFHENPLFWLQYGSLELEGEGGNLSYAENYLLQAESLDRYNNPFIQNAICLLYYKKCINEPDFLAAQELKLKADELANELFDDYGSNDNHLYHIYCKGCFEYIKKWINNKTEKVSELRLLKKAAENAMILFPRDREIEKLSNDITRAYLSMGIKNYEQ